MSGSRDILERALNAQPARPDDLEPIVASIEAETGRNWRVARRFKGGANGGAYLLTDTVGQNVVLKVQTSNPERILAADSSVDGAERLRSARQLVELARDHGWPTPRWEAAGRASNGVCWALQAFVEGVQPPLLDVATADWLIEIFTLQAGMLPGHAGGWDAWVHRVLYDDWEKLRRRVLPLPGGDAIVGRVDAIAAACVGVNVTAHDLVHGDFNLTNTLVNGQGLWIIDAESLQSGPRALDPIKALIVSNTFGHASPDGLDRLWAYAASFDPREFALCAAAATLKIAEGVVRHGLQEAAPAFLAKKIYFLDRVQRLTGF